MSAVGPIAQQGIISTQVEHVVVAETKPATTEAAAVAPPPPPAETGRGSTLDTSA